MKEIVVISGKGGTGKTSITASFALLGGKDIVVADCDVDAADMHLLLQPDFAVSEDFYSGVLAEINQDECIPCGKCADICRFKAIPVMNNQYCVLPLNCEGCGYCARVCPTDAITMRDQNVGQWFVSATRAGNPMVHARLGIGAENSGKLVAKVKKEANRIAKETNRNFILVDGSPGVGCPVVSSLSGADFVILVTEPTVSGLHDLKRAYQLAAKFRIEAGCIINKSDLNRKVCAEIEDFLKKEGIVHISSLPYDETFTDAMTAGQTVVEYENNSLSAILAKSWEKVKNLLSKENQ